MLGHKQKILIILIYLTLSPGIYGQLQLPHESSKVKPNVIVILSDDQGSMDTNLIGSKDLYTPNMDSLALSGIRFTNFYASSSICSPSRAALLTGKSPLAASVPALVRPNDTLTDMPSREYTMAELFRDNGYKTALIGKWHLGQTPDTNPNAQGFDYFFGHYGGCIDNYSHFFYWNGPNRHDLKRNSKEVFYDGHHFSDLMVDEAQSFISNNKNQPFFLFWSSNLPHYPIQPKQKWLTYYDSLPQPRRGYAALISTLDEKIGELLNYLKSEKLLDNTIVVFMSDHGHSEEERNFFGGGNAGLLRGSKFTFFEGGIKVPAFISWPKEIEKNQVRNQMAIGHDWYPTLASLCGLSIPNDKAIEGKSLADVLFRNEPSPHDYLSWYMEWPGHRPQVAVRKGNWKLIKNGLNTGLDNPLMGKDTIFLSNLESHPYENENLVESNPVKLKELMALHEKWINTLKD